MQPKKTPPEKAVTGTMRSAHKRGVNPTKRDWVIVGLLLVFFTLNFADKASIGFSASQIKADLAIGDAEYGLLSSGFFWLFAAGAVGIGALFRWVNLLWGAPVLMLAWVATMIPLTMETSFLVLFLSRMALGFFEGPAHALCQGIVAVRFSPQKRALAGSIVNAGSSLGPLLSAPVLTWVIIRFHWHAAFLVLVIIGLVWVLIWLMTNRGRLQMFNSRLPESERALLAGREENTDANEDIRVPFYTYFRLGSFWGLAILSFGGYIITSLKTSWLPVFMHEGLGYSQEATGVLVTIPYACAVVVLISSGAISGWLLTKGFTSKVARSYLTAVLLIFAGVCLITFSGIDHGWPQLVLVVCAFSINSVAFSTAFAGASDFLPAKHRVGFFGCIIAVYSVAGILAPYVVGIIVDRSDTVQHGYSFAFQVAGVAIVICALIGGYLLDPERSRRVLLTITARREGRLRAAGCESLSADSKDMGQAPTARE
ncbi:MULTISPECIES: MFS transporter [unclassified Brevibacterium]|uniref:MFS transporter n=1 Tax=unclassified Brevibacterium TaxID=2614124 RepID=UPI001E293B32|nr:MULTISPECIES: MFS transporter [unclassified Brevibacterium]MDK8433420.1 MFS transporter [Brevibacterium sp. H-BE7]